MIVKSLSDKRFIIQALINGKSGNLLIDTGASISLINSNVVKKYNKKNAFKALYYIALTPFCKKNPLILIKMFFFYVEKH